MYNKLLHAEKLLAALLVSNGYKLPEFSGIGFPLFVA